MRSKSFFLIPLVLFLFMTGLFAESGGLDLELDYHIGAGLTLPFYEDQATIALPMAYGGIGVNLIPELALGAEYELFGFYLLGYGILVHMPKAYVKYELGDIFTVSALGGMAFPTVFSPDDSQSFPDANVGVAGIRATLFFVYAEYLFLLNREAPISAVSLGVAIKR